MLCKGFNFTSRGYQLEMKWNNGLRKNILYWCWDDLQQVCEKDKEVAEMFTVGSHHLNFSLIYLCHNIFGKGCFHSTDQSQQSLFNFVLKK